MLQMRPSRSYKARLSPLTFELLVLTIAASQEGSPTTPFLLVAQAEVFPLLFIFISRVTAICI